VGEGSFGFTVPARSFAARTVVIRVSDYAGRSDEVRRGGFVVTTCIPEAISALGLVVAFVCIGRGGKHA
jgi:F0F1-type ATP synthase membrane subunit c/vacuolar-type H+-ATPase subunit K